MTSLIGVLWNKALKAAGVRTLFGIARDRVVNGVKLRVLEQPPVRRELRNDFPEINTFRGKYAVTSNRQKAANLIDRELRKHGLSLKSVKRINIIYPHKNPALYPFHTNEAEQAARDFREAMRAFSSDTDFVIAHEICENRHLNRSSMNQISSMRGIGNDWIDNLLDRQIFDLYTPNYKRGHLPFIEADHQGKEFFVIVDDCVATGTTLANMISFIEHNGGVVLAAFTDDDSRACLPQQKERYAPAIEIGPVFNDAARNTGKLKNLAQSFAQSAAEKGKDWSPQECLEKFETALNRHHNSVFAMTDQETSLLSSYVRKKDGFPGLINRLK